MTEHSYRATIDFLTDLWGQGYHSLCRGQGGAGFTLDSLHASPEALLARAIEISDGDLWFGVQPLAQVPPVKLTDRGAVQPRGGVEDVGTVSWLQGDFDHDVEDHNVHAKVGTWSRLDLGRELSYLRPTYVVESGHGYHAYWRLSEPLPNTPELRARILAHWRNVDGATGLKNERMDLASVLRLPGSTNFKNPAAPKPVHVVAYDPSAPAVTLPEAEAPTMATRQEARQGSLRESLFEKHGPMPWLPFGVLGMLVCAQPGERNHELHAAAFTLGANYQFGRVADGDCQEILDIMRNVAVGLLGLPEQEVAATIASGYRRGCEAG